MEEIKDAIYFLGVVHANALTAVWYFILTQTSHSTNTVHMRPAKGFRGNKKA